MGRHGAGDPDDPGESGELAGSGAWRWEPVPDEPAEADPRRRARVRLLVAACVVGAIAIVAITVVLVRLAVRDVNDRTGPTQIHQRYEARYEACVAGGSSAAACAERVFDQCAADDDWGRSPDQRAVLDNCRFGPAAQASTSASSTAS